MTNGPCEYSRPKLYYRIILYYSISWSKGDIYYLRIENAEGNVLIAVYLFIYLFVCVLLA